MSYSAAVYRILIYISSDLSVERNEILEAIRLWNENNSEENDVVLMPVVWDTVNKNSKDSFVDVFNSKPLSKSDILIAFFWTRVDYESEDTLSKIINNLEKLSESNKSALLFFYTMPVFSQSIDHDKYQRLIELKLNLDKKGITEDYDSATELEQKLGFRLSKIVDDLKDKTVIEFPKKELQDEPEVPDSEENKNVISNMTSYLSYIGKNLDVKKGQKVIKDIENQISKLKSLKEHSDATKGETTINKLFSKGDELLQSFREVVIIPSSKDDITPTDDKEEIKQEKDKQDPTEIKSKEKAEEELKTSDEATEVEHPRKSKPKAPKKAPKSKRKTANKKTKPKEVEKTDEEVGDEIDPAKSGGEKLQMDERIKLPKLGEIKEEILKILAEADEIGVKKMGETEIQNATNLSEMDVSYNLVSLADDKYISVTFNNSKNPLYKLSDTGKDYLQNKGLI